jgi:hypothetical protein
MDTFLIFVFVFGIFGWCIWKLLKFTKNTIGENSPLKVVRVYQIAELQYFLKLENLLIYYISPLGFLFTKVAFTVVSSDISMPLTRLLLFSMGLMFFLACGLYLILDINHWKYTRNVTLETNPATYELDLRFEDQTLTIREGDLEKIVVASNEGKIRFTYFTYYLKNGDHFILSDRMPGNWVIGEYFKNIPLEYRHERFPYIK